MKKRAFINTAVTIIFLFGLLFFGEEILLAQPGNGMGHHDDKGMHASFFELLTKDQLAEIQSLVETLREAGSDREAVRKAVDAKLDEWGVERPEPPKGGGHGMHGGPFADLTEEQRAELETLVKTLREAGSDREVVRKAVDAKLDEWGIERLEPPEGGRYGGPGKHGMPFKDLLTDEQQTELETMISSMRDAGSSRDEVHEAVESKLEEWGIEIPEKPDQNIHEAMKGLTADQRKQVHELVKDMHEQGAERKVIQDAVKSMLESFGIEMGDSSESGDSKVETQNNYGSTILAASNFPNPFNPETRISFELGKAARVRVSVYNVKGQLVNTLMDEYRNEGTCQVQWNGTLGNGDTAPSGMYFFKINADDETLTESMLLMK